MIMIEEMQRPHPLHLSAGAGIAIAGAWLAASALTISMLLIAFTFNHTGLSNEILHRFEHNFWAAILILLIFGWPLGLAMGATKLILGKED